MTARVMRAGSTVNLGNIIRRFADKSEVRADLAFRKMVLLVFSEIIIRSPVDTGRFRSNWFTTIRQPSKRVTDAKRRDPLPPVKRAVEGSNKFGRYFLTNNLPYAQALENGHSGQAPRGMVRIAMRKASSHLKQAVKEIEG